MPEPTLAARIAYFLERAGITQGELALRVGVVPSAVTAWLVGGGNDRGYNPSSDRLPAIAKALGVTLSVFYGSLEDKADEEAKAAG